MSEEILLDDQNSCRRGTRENDAPQNHRAQRDKRKPKIQTNPLQRGIEEFLKLHIPSSFFAEHNISKLELFSSLPKRYNIYPPLLLLPQNTFCLTPQWVEFYSSLDQGQAKKLYTCIAASFSAQGVTHLAVNAPIAPIKASSGDENRLRSPTGLVPLHGDFSHPPADLNHRTGNEGDPADSDLKSAFWVQAVQNSGVVQVWAPLYSMFSRGNITEKARILGTSSTMEGLTETELGLKLEDVAVVDMYAGIGYFVFSYLKRGIGRVWAWELNGWSIEGLKRGCQANGWGVKSIRVDSAEGVSNLAEFLEGIREEDRVVAFHGDNEFAADTLLRIREILETRGAWKPIRHVNLGLLPTSKGSWSGAVRLLDSQSQGWIHVHENVDIAHVDEEREQIVDELDSLVQCTRKVWSSGATHSKVSCRHVEKVKTYAPGVMHCVFDIHVPSTALMGISEIQNP